MAVKHKGFENYRGVYAANGTFQAVLKSWETDVRRKFNSSYSPVSLRRDFRGAEMEFYAPKSIFH